MLTPRENQILRAVVHEYVNSAQPVGSQVLRVRYGLGISPATIRNVMNALTEAGYLTQPHTSAGRIPTERAYRLFVEGAQASAPSVGEQEKLRTRLAKAGGRETALQLLANQLSELSGSIGLAVDGAGKAAFNLSNVLGQPGFEDPRVVHYVAGLLDNAADWLPAFATEPGQATLRIGQENEDWRAQAVSVVAVNVGSAKDPAYVAVIGPNRMPYRKLMSLMEFGAKQLEESHGRR
jgi:transcriptional regulator of heat shock response